MKPIDRAVAVRDGRVVEVEPCGDIQHPYLPHEILIAVVDACILL